MITAGDLIDEASAQLHGWGISSDTVTPLQANIGPTDTTFIVDFTAGQSVGISPGVVEIDSEQLYVVTADPSTGICTLAQGFGRGYGGTTAASHSAGAKVVSEPRFPRLSLFNQLNEVLGSVFPQLFAVATFTGTVSYPSNTYMLPATFGTPINVLDAQWQDPLGNWDRLFSYRIDPFDGSFRLGSGGMVGRPLRVIYSSQPPLFTSESDDFTATTGLPVSTRDVLTLGVVAFQVPALDIARAQLTSVEQSDRSRVVPPNQGVNAAKYVMAEFQNRLANEAASLRRQYPSRITRTF